MFFNIDIKGNLLPRGTVCLTYDDGPGETEGDGPGPRTLELARYLHSEGIGATFFVVGQHARQLPGVLRDLSDLGHLVGNHTDTHPGLVAFTQRGGDVVGEVSRTDDLIRTQSCQPVTFLRPPYGNWRERENPDTGPDLPFSAVAGMLNRSALASRYVGPINWDISAKDFDWWRDRRPAHECAAAYLERIDHVGSGIVLMHDSSEDEHVRANNQTYAMTRMLVPALKTRGYRFVRLDSIPQVQTSARVSALVALRSSSGLYLTAQGAEGLLSATAKTVGAEEQFGLVAIERERQSFALRASNGLLATMRDPEGGPGANAREDALLLVERISHDRIYLRTGRGGYCECLEGRVAVRASTHSNGAAEPFALCPLF